MKPCIPSCLCRRFFTGVQKVDPLWNKNNLKKSRQFCIFHPRICTWEIDLFLTLLILTARGSDPGLGQEELPAGTDTHLEEALGVPGNISFAQRQVRHAHRLSVQHQLLDSHRYTQRDSAANNPNILL